MWSDMILRLTGKGNGKLKLGEQRTKAAFGHALRDKNRRNPFPWIYQFISVPVLVPINTCLNTHTLFYLELVEAQCPIERFVVFQEFDDPAVVPVGVGLDDPSELKSRV